MRSIWQTKTFKSASFASLMIGVMTFAPDVESILKKATPENAPVIQESFGVLYKVLGLLGFGGTAGSVLGRAAATGAVVSPTWMPGKNIKDEEIEERFIG